MNLVVERGIARCPRCVSIADYSFVECGLDSIRYEVQCRRCGELYSETSSTGATELGTDVEPYAFSGPPRNGATDGAVAKLRRWCSAVTEIVGAHAAARWPKRLPRTVSSDGARYS